MICRFECKHLSRVYKWSDVKCKYVATLVFVYPYTLVSFRFDEMLIFVPCNNVLPSS